MNRTKKSQEQYKKFLHGKNAKNLVQEVNIKAYKIGSVKELIVSQSSVSEMVKRTDGRESPILTEPADADGNSDKTRCKYGELVILGYNGYLPQGDRGRRRSKFLLSKRTSHNGVKRSRHYVVQSPETTHAILDTTQHSISYTLSRNQAVIVEYQEDEATDMFQVGRSSESPIDFVVMDTLPGDKKDAKVMQSTISRFACRILVDRNEPHRAKIYAAGFDSSRNIFLGVSKKEKDKQR